MNNSGLVTQEELVANRLEELRNTTMWQNSPPKYKRTLVETYRTRAENEWYALNEKAYIEGKDVSLSGRPDWSLTAEQVAYRSDDTLDEYIIKEHDESVKQAIDEGKPIPPDALTDYQSRLRKPTIQVDDDVIWHSPHTDEDIVMNFRGYEGDKAVLYNKKSGFQTQVPKEQIKSLPQNPRKAVSTRMIQGVKHYYVGRTLFWNKAKLEGRHLIEQGIGFAITKRKDAGYLLWATKPVWVDLGEPFSNPSKLVKTTVRPEALTALKRMRSDKAAGHDAEDYWRGAASAYFTANPKRKKR